MAVVDPGGGVHEVDADTLGLRSARGGQLCVIGPWSTSDPAEGGRRR